MVAAVIWTIGALALIANGVQDPMTMAFAGFAFVYGFCHRRAQGFHIVSLCAGIAGALAGISTMGMIWAHGHGGFFLFFLTTYVFLAIAYHTGRRLKHV